jgi:hypothetical protein
MFEPEQAARVIAKATVTADTPTCLRELVME